MASASSTSSAAAARPAAVRRLGRFELLRLLGKSERTMCWQVNDSRSRQDLVLMLPRSQPQGAQAQEHWAQRVRKAARLDHPGLPQALEVGQHDGWPYIAYELGDCATLADRVGNKGMGAVEAVQVMVQVLQALAFAHDAGLAHHDLQLFSILVTDKGVARLLGLDVACLAGELHARGAGADVGSMRAQRDAAQIDVLRAGVLMHHVLTGAPALDEADTMRVVYRLPPGGREIVRLPWTTPRPIPEPLRVIVNRATDRQERQRYHNARTLLRALEGWLQVEDGSQHGALVLLLDRMRNAGVLPASPGTAERAARLASMEGGHTSDLAEALLDDTALAFEVLRAVNTAQVRGAQVSGNGPVLTVRRAVAMLGLDGVRRVALGLRAWPGPLSELHAQDLMRTMERARRAGRLAVAIRPAGYDAEVVYLVTLLQNIGRLVVHYHFAEEAAQIRKLTLPLHAEAGGGEEPGMTEQGASTAVLGADIESIGAAVVRWWGMDDSVLHMSRRLPTATPVRAVENDDEMLRAVASCANEAMDALALPAARVMPALQHVVQRYARALNLTGKDLQTALQQIVGKAAGARSDDTNQPAASGSAADVEERVDT